MRQLTMTTLLVLLSTPALMSQRTIHVDVTNPNCPGGGTAANPYCTIQDGIQAATNGDLVLVRPGTYKGKVDFLGKAIKVLSSQGSGVTVIDGFGSPVKSVVSFRNGETSQSVLQGFTIVNGMGVQFTWGTLTRWFGGGIFCEKTSPTLRDLVIHSNVADFGAGIACVYGASPSVEACLIYNNFAVTNGGGVVAMTDCKPTFKACVFRDNACAHTGGGLNYRGESSPVLVNCTFDGNFARDYGGAIRAGANSGGTITNCTFVNNKARVGGGLAAGSDTAGKIGTIQVTNSIFWGNRALYGPQISLNGIFPAVIDLASCDVQGGKAQLYIKLTNPTGGAINWGDGMLSADPKFVDAPDRDYHIRDDSPCRDKGTNTPPAMPSWDFEGDPRQAGAAVDIGMDEFFPHLYQDERHLTPGGKVVIQVLGPKGQPVVWLFAGGYLQKPIAIPGLTGLFRLNLLSTQLVFVGTVPTSGLIKLQLPIPMSVPKNLILPSQALVFPQLTNLLLSKIQ